MSFVLNFQSNTNCILSFYFHHHSLLAPLFLNFCPLIPKQKCIQVCFLCCVGLYGKKTKEKTKQNTKQNKTKQPPKKTPKQIKQSKTKTIKIQKTTTTTTKTKNNKPTLQKTNKLTQNKTKQKQWKFISDHKSYSYTR